MPIGLGLCENYKGSDRILWDLVGFLWSQCVVQNENLSNLMSEQNEAKNN